MTPVASWAAHTINGAATLPHDATTMATAVEALGVEFGTPREASNEGRAVAWDSLVHTVRQARAARRGTLVLCINEMQEEAVITGGLDKGKAPPDTREEPRQWAKLGARDALCTGGAQGCLTAEGRQLTLTSNGKTGTIPL